MNKMGISLFFSPHSLTFRPIYSLTLHRTEKGYTAKGRTDDRGHKSGSLGILAKPLKKKDACSGNPITQRQAVPTLTTFPVGGGIQTATQRMKNEKVEILDYKIFTSDSNKKIIVAQVLYKGMAFFYSLTYSYNGILSLLKSSYLNTLKWNSKERDMPIDDEEIDIAINDELSDIIYRTENVK